MSTAVMAASTESMAALAAVLSATLRAFTVSVAEVASTVSTVMVSSPVVLEPT
ncbi:hypothetical protein D3C78_1669650 [compost metagenome]